MSTAVTAFGNRPHAIPCSHPFVDDDYSPSPNNYPYNSCQSYVILDPTKRKVLFSKKSEEVREMASLTKIMTCIVSIQLAASLKLNLTNTYFRVSLSASRTIGTSANLIEGQMVSINDLLYGLMLPSGNDAAVTLAEGFTDLLFKAKTKLP